MVAYVLFANSYEYLEDLANLLDVDSYESFLKHLRRDRWRALWDKFKRDRELIDFLPRIGQEASCEAKLLCLNKRFKSNMKTLLSNTAISASDGFEKIACSLNLSQHSVY